MGYSSSWFEEMSGGGTSLRPATDTVREGKPISRPPANAFGSIKNDDEHEQRQSAVSEPGRRGEVSLADRKARFGLAQ
jgi:hypothetical protein